MSLLDRKIWRNFETHDTRPLIVGGIRQSSSPAHQENPRALDVPRGVRFQNPQDSYIMEPQAPSSAIDADPFKMHPPTSLSTSSSAPLTATQQQPSDGENITGNYVTSKNIATSAGEDDIINKKINAMLAASEALKPALAFGPGSPGHQKSRFVSRMSSTWDKFHPKSTSRDYETQSKEYPKFY